MSLSLYNTLTKNKEELSPINPPQVNMYTCGVTVYDECHIGHARSLYIFDVIRKYLAHRGYKVNFVRNITDIDDKIINKAKELGKPASQVAKGCIESYKKDIKALNISKADKEPLATEHIKDIIKHIEGLIEKEYAYVIDGNVYFRVKRFQDYGKLSGSNLEQMMAGTRIEKDESKEDPLDFALWKRSKEGEPKWDSPWGKGRPGWHIECSVMSMKYLGQTFDIHAGGWDLVFPHHENEIAQSEALTGKPFAKYWIHHGLLTINGQKMAKSLGNFITIKDFLNKYNADLLKLFFLSAHYSQPMDFTEDKMLECKKQKRNFDSFIDKVNNWGLLKGSRVAKSQPSDKSSVDKVCAKLENSMDDDFNTPQALACLFELVDLGSKFISQDKQEAFVYAKSRLESFFKIFGLSVKPKKKIPKELLKKAEQRRQYKINKDYKNADAVRQEIKSKFGYYVSDTSGNLSFEEVED